MKILRVLDVVLAICGLVALLPIFFIIYFVSWIDNRSPLFMQQRVGWRQKPFFLVKFRTMRSDTADLPTHLVHSSAVTRHGRFLRRTKLDELPQVWNVLIGEMSFVGPRPGLPSHHELTKAREAAGVFASRPGITGRAQISGIDMSTPELLAKTDAEMLRDLNLKSYFRYIFMTIIGRGRGDKVK